MLLLLASTLFVLKYYYNNKSERPRVLIFHKTEFYAHECLPAAKAAVEALCARNGWTTDATEWGEDFTEENLSRYAAVVFLLTAGDVLNPTQEVVFERFIQGGGGFVGIYTAIDTEHSWPWYRQLVGADYDGLMPVQEALLSVLDFEHPSTEALSPSWRRTDEWMNLKNIHPEARVLVALEEGSCVGGKMGTFHPVSWCREFDGGRAFVTAMGHTVEAYGEAAFLKHLEGGLKYAVGAGKPVVLAKHRPFEAATQKEGFVKTSFVCNLAEPMSMCPLPDGRILFVERRGAVKLFNPADGKTALIATLEVFHKNEEGLLGIAVDPEWEQNHWIYLYYAPKEGSEALRLSRFVFREDHLDIESEQVLLEVPTDRDVHALHAAGCLRFDRQGFLYLSTGDNTDHYGDGFSAIDERPGKKQYDAQKSAANSMDLRGKILRIKPLPDGSYICPAGNLYVEEAVRVYRGGEYLLYDPAWEGTLYPVRRPYAASICADYPKRFGVWAGRGRPEIYIMGCRNPFRMDFDHRRNLLIWGEPGPDAGVADSTRGPEGYDEINVAARAGFYGWPYCIGPNLPYREYDYGTGACGKFYDPEHPFNDSPNNTGDRYLPPSQPPLLWYSFKSNPQLPLLLNGTRCAMGGPAYYCDEYPPATRLPKRFDGKILIYEWMRNWIMAVGIDSAGRYTDMQPMAPHIRLGRPIDLFIDKNGSLWVLEYGTEWFSPNPDACLSRIDYIRGNSDEDEVDEVQAANQPPSVEWLFNGANGSFYRPGDTLHYALQVFDPKSGSLTDGGIQPSEVVTYIGPRVPQSALSKLTQALPSPAEHSIGRGQKLVNESDCRSCHAIERKINGPAYRDVAGRYDGDTSALRRLTEKIIKGGKGVWGEVAMSAHPQLAETDVKDMVRWILSLKEEKEVPLFGRGQLVTAETRDPKAKGYVFYARYTEPAGGEQTAQKGESFVALRPAQLSIFEVDSTVGTTAVYERPLNNRRARLQEYRNGDFFVLKNVDPKRLRGFSLAVEVSPNRGHLGRGHVEIRIGHPDSTLVGSAPIPSTNFSGALSEVVVPIVPQAWPLQRGRQDVYFVFRAPHDAEHRPLCGVAWLNAVLF